MKPLVSINGTTLTDNQVLYLNRLLLAIFTDYSEVIFVAKETEDTFHLRSIRKCIFELMTAINGETSTLIKHHRLILTQTDEPVVKLDGKALDANYGLIVRLAINASRPTRNKAERGISMREVDALEGAVKRNATIIAAVAKPVKGEES